MITTEDYFGHMTRTEQPSDMVKSNASELLIRVNALLAFTGFKTSVNSGWRPASYNALVPGAAQFSKHITGQAIDLADPEGELDDMLFKNPTILINHQLWLEHPLATKNWCHLQSVGPRSGNRIFFP